MRVVLDTNVVLAGLLSKRGASHWILRGLLDGRLQAVASVPVFLEYEAVVTRRDDLRKIGWTTTDADAFLRALAAVVKPPAISFLWRPAFASPGDEMFVECAVAGDADAIVTFNVRHYHQAARRFRFRVLTPRETVPLLRKAGLP